MDKKNRMKILIGTPIHQMKDYAMARWLKNVSKLQQKYPADLLLVDNSPGVGYVKKVKSYCAKYDVKNYRIKHVEMSQKVIRYERIEFCQEVIRKEILSKDYAALFSWESDVLIPADALDHLVKIMNSGNFMIVIHNSWKRMNPTIFDFEMGCTLISRKAMEKHSFLTPPLPPGTDHWEGEDDLFKNRVLNDGSNYVLACGVINPIHHLDG